MTSGLAISGLVAWGFSQSPTLMGAIYGTALQWVVMLAPLGFIFFLVQDYKKCLPLQLK